MRVNLGQQNLDAHPYLLVAPMTKTPLRLSIPSISVSSWLTTRALESFEPPAFPPSRLGQSASNSSKNMTQGEEFLAR